MDSMGVSSHGRSRVDVGKEAIRAKFNMRHSKWLVSGYGDLTGRRRSAASAGLVTERGTQTLPLLRTGNYLGIVA